jgi:hypothetical protein
MHPRHGVAQAKASGLVMLCALLIMAIRSMLQLRTALSSPALVNTATQTHRLHNARNS